MKIAFEIEQYPDNLLTREILLKVTYSGTDLEITDQDFIEIQESTSDSNIVNLIVESLSNTDAGSYDVGLILNYPLQSQQTACQTHLRMMLPDESDQEYQEEYQVAATFDDRDPNSKYFALLSNKVVEKQHVLIVDCDSTEDWRLSLPNIIVEEELS